MYPIADIGIAIGAKRAESTVDEGRPVSLSIVGSSRDCKGK
jgi:hypothetical protein